MEDLAEIRAVVDRAEQIYGSGHRVEALALLKDVKFSGESMEDPLYARFLCARGAAEAETGQTQAAAASFESALEYHRARNQKSEMGVILFNLGNVAKYSGRLRDAEDNYGRAIDCFQDAGEKQMVVLAGLSLSNLIADGGDWDRCRASLGVACAALDDDQLQPGVLWSKRFLQMKLAIADGDEAVAVERGRQAAEAAARAGDAINEAESLVALAVTLARRGETREARNCALRAREALRDGSGKHTDKLRRKVRATLMKINNLDFAFSAAATGTEAIEAAVPLEPAGTTATPPDAGVKVPLMVAQGVGGSKAEFLRHLDGICRAQGVGCLCLFSEQDAWILPLAGVETVVLDVQDPPTWTRLAEEWAASGPGAQALQQVAPRLCQAGVDLKSAWRVTEAHLHYALALRVALRLHLIDGVEAITGNLYKLAKQVIAHFKHPSESMAGNWDVRLTGGNILVEPDSAEDKQPVDFLLDFSRTEAKQALASFEDVKEWTPAAEDPGLRLKVLRSLSRLRRLAGKRADREWLAEICRLCRRIGDVDAALESIYESLADTDFLDMLTYLGKVDSKEPGDLESAWELYLEWRPRAVETASTAPAVAASLAIGHFEILRASAVAGGGAFGHRISYDTTQFPARIGRDLIRMMIPGDRQQQLDALWQAETTCSRALVDWMGRTHANNRLTIRKGITRSVGEVRCASVKEIFSIAAQTCTTILYYVAVADGFVRWDIYPDGAWNCTLIGDLAPDLLRLFRALPFTFDAPDFARTRTSGLAAAKEKQKDDLDRLLLDLGDRLLPESLRSPAEGAPRARIAVVADQMLQFVPFSCLRLDASAYLVDRADVVYWPSATAWMLCSQAESPHGTEPDPAAGSIVVGGPDFSQRLPIFYRGVQRSVELEDLPGARAEAAAIGGILGVKPLLASAASFAAVFEVYGAAKGRTVPVLHLATHGLTDTWDAEQSFIAFSDQLVTADSLYTYDAGLATRLVMLSCCQTAIGYTHPDSILGLANAFLVAGACTVGSTLWNVEDDATSILMSRFYQEIKAGADASAAMSAAQRHLRSTAPWSHPIYWAPFRIGGSFSNPLSGGTA